MVKQVFIILVCIIVPVQSFDLRDYIYDDANITEIEFSDILGEGRPSGPSGPSGADSQRGYSPLSNSKTNLTNSSNTTTTPTTIPNPMATSFPATTPSSTSSTTRTTTRTTTPTRGTTTTTTRKVDARSGNNGQEIKRGDQQSASNGTGGSKSDSQDDLPDSTTKTDGTIFEQPVGRITEKTALENSLIKILLNTIQQHLDTRVERDHPNPYGPVNFLINYFDIFISTNFCK